MEAYEEIHRFENFVKDQGKSPEDYEFHIEFDIPRQSDAFPATGRVFIRRKTDEWNKIYRFGAGMDWLYEFSNDMDR